MPRQFRLSRSISLKTWGNDAKRERFPSLVLPCLVWPPSPGGSLSKIPRSALGDRSLPAGSIRKRPISFRLIEGLISVKGQARDGSQRSNNNERRLSR